MNDHRKIDWLSPLLIVLILVGISCGVATLLVFIGGPEPTATHQINIVVPGTPIGIEKLLPAQQFGHGLYKVQVDGRTFLMWVSNRGMFLTEYEPKEDQP